MRRAALCGGCLVVRPGRKLRRSRRSSLPAEFAPPSDGAADEELAELAVCTFNIEFAEHVTQAISELSGDEHLRTCSVVLLQEMDWPGARRVAEALALDVVYYPGSVQHDKDFGNAVLSKWPIVDDKKLILPHRNPTNGRIRIAVSATLGTPFSPITAYSVHGDTRGLGLPRASTKPRQLPSTPRAGMSRWSSAGTAIRRIRAASKARRRALPRALSRGPHGAFQPVSTVRSARTPSTTCSCGASPSRPRERRRRTRATTNRSGSSSASGLSVPPTRKLEGTSPLLGALRGAGVRVLRLPPVRDSDAARRNGVLGERRRSAHGSRIRSSGSAESGSQHPQGTRSRARSRASGERARCRSEYAR